MFHQLDNQTRSESDGKRLPAPQIRCTLSGSSDSSNSDSVLNCFAAKQEIASFPNFSTIQSSNSSFFKSWKKPKIFYIVRNFVQSSFEKFLQNPIKDDEGCLSPRVGYKLEASSVIRGPVGPRSLVYRYDKHVHLRDSKTEAIQRQLFNEYRHEKFAARSEFLFGLFKTFNAEVLGQPTNNRNEIPHITENVLPRETVFSNVGNELLVVALDYFSFAPPPPLSPKPFRTRRTSILGSNSDLSYSETLVTSVSEPVALAPIDLLFEALQTSVLHDKRSLPNDFPTDLNKRNFQWSHEAWSSVFLPTLVPMECGLPFHGASSIEKPNIVSVLT